MDPAKQNAHMHTKYTHAHTHAKTHTRARTHVCVIKFEYTVVLCIASLALAGSVQVFLI